VNGLIFPVQSLWIFMEGKSLNTTTAESSGGEDEGGVKNESSPILSKSF
jgi:hypothetical protein